MLERIKKKLKCLKGKIKKLFHLDEGIGGDIIVYSVLAVIICLIIF